MNKLLMHLQTIHIHRKYVRKMCFNLGILWRGLVHDLSKYSPTELSIYKYYDGKRSPHEIARLELGYSPSWIHHKRKNKHHWEYWVDSFEDNTCVKMPWKYCLEMFADITGASKSYGVKNPNWTTEEPLKYWINKCVNKRRQHIQSRTLVQILLIKYAELGEPEFIKWFKLNKKVIKKYYVENKIQEYNINNPKAKELFEMWEK